MTEFDDIIQEETIDVKKYIAKIISNWYWFALALILTLSGAYLLNRYSDPIYGVNSSLLIREDNSSSYFDDEMIPGLDLFKQGVNLQNQIGILRSYDLNKKVIEELDFDISYYSIGHIRNPELYQPVQLEVHVDTNYYQVYGEPIYVDVLSAEELNVYVDGDYGFNKTVKYGEQISTDYFNFKITIRNPEAFYDVDKARYYFVINSTNHLVNKYRSKVSVGFLDEESTILNLSVQGFVAAKEVNFLNKLAEVYIRSGLEDKNQIAKRTIHFIDEQIHGVIDSLTIAEGKLEKFRTENRVIDLSQEGRSLYDQYEQLERERAVLVVESKYYSYLEEYLVGRQGVNDIIVPTSVGIRDQVLVSTIMQINTLNQQRLSVQMGSLKSNPRLDLIDSQIQGYKGVLTENVKNLQNTNKIGLDDINERIAILNVDIEKLPYNERKLISIQRKFNLNDQIYTYLLEKRAETGIMMASNIPAASVLDKARRELAWKVGPKTKMNYLIALVMGLFIPFLVIILRDFFNNKITSRKDIDGRTSAPIIGTVGHNAKESDLVVMDSPKSSISESFRTIKTNLQYLLVESDSRIITVTSTISGEGKTFCSVNLACIIAHSNKKTLLIGMDMRKPKMHSHFKMSNGVGLSNYLIGKKTIEEVVQKTADEYLDIIVSGPVPPNPATLLETKALEDLIAYAHKNYDFVVIDTPPIALVSDALLLAKHSDINLFVIRQNYSRTDVLDLINDLNKNKSIPDFNILVNDVKLSGYYGNKYGYEYGYGYGYGYGQGYYDDDEEDDINLLQKLKRKMRFS